MKLSPTLTRNYPTPAPGLDLRADALIPPGAPDCAPYLNPYLAMPGTRLTFTPTKFYGISSPLKPDRGVAMESYGDGAVITANANFIGAWMLHQHRDGFPVLADEPGPTGRVYLRDMEFNGGNFVQHGGLFSLQQRAHFESVRFSNFPGTGVRFVDTTDPLIDGLQVLDCDIGVELVNCIPITLNNLNVERCNGRAMLVRTYASGGGISSAVWINNLHLEGGGDILIEVNQSRTLQFVIDKAYIAPDGNGKTIFKFAPNTDTERQHSYTLKNIWLNGVDNIFIDDPAIVGNPLHGTLFGTAHAQINYFISPNADYGNPPPPISAIVITDPTGVRRL